MGKLSITYELEVGPLPVGVDEYADSTNRAYKELLSNCPGEPEVQVFFEKHPWLVPGPLTPSGASGHYPLHCSLITQPKLPGADLYIPDFMWIAKHSGAWFPTLIEIENPGKKIFNQDGTPSAKFTKARNQLEQWRAWFNRPENTQMFLSYYGIPQSFRDLTVQPHMILVYGRRSEFDCSPKLALQRGALISGHDAELMSFDRLSANVSMSNAITVKAVGSGKYQAVWIPPTFMIGPNLTRRFFYIGDIPQAIELNPEINRQRKEFLRRRIDYWKEWESSSGTKVRSSGDWE